MKKQKGFSLIELLIVVAIILIIAAIAIPNLMRSKMAANEASAVASLRTINTGEVTYQNTYNTFTADLATLGPGAAVCGTPSSTASCLIDNLLATSIDATHLKSGYFFKVAGGAATYTSEAQPGSAGSSGIRGFCSDQNLVLFYVTPGTGAMGNCTTAAGTPL